METAKRPYRWSILLVILFGIGAILCYAVVGYIKYRFSQPVGSGPAGPVVSQVPFESTWTDRKVLLLGLGDSVTAGFGVQSCHSYFNRLIENPPDEYDDMKGLCLSRVLPHLESRNQAVSGSTSLDHLKQVEKELENQPAELFGLVVMTTGGNDLIHDYGRSPPREGAMYGATLEQARPWIENYRVRLGKILDRITESFPGGCLIFLADIYDPTDGVGNASDAGLPDWPDGLAILQEYNTILHDAAEARENVVLVPMHDLFLGHGIYCTDGSNKHYCSEDPYYWYGYNLEDPNHRGYDALRRLFLNKIVKHRDEIR